MILEDLVNQKPFYNACRHHVYELVVIATYKAVFGKETLRRKIHFNQFFSRWSKLDLIQNINTFNLSCEWMRSQIDLVVLELQQLLIKHTKDKEILIRNDYRECAENSFAILGSSTRDFKYRRPGAMSSSRCMGKVIDCQKMFMLANQQEYEEEYVAPLCRINVFLCLFYVPAWLKCSVSADALIIGLSFMKYMPKYCQIDHEIAESACDI